MSMRQLDQFQAEKAILEAILEDETAPERAEATLARAEELDCDPLAVLLHRSMLDQDVILRRTAALFGLRYVGDITPFVTPFAPDANVDAFAGLSSVKGRMRGADVLFVAPRLRQLPALAARGERIVLTSPRGLIAAITKVNADRLLDESIQRTIRQYPNCCANTELRKSHRLGLVLSIVAVILAALFAPMPVQLALLPLLTLVLISPSLLRLWAAVTARENVPLPAGELLEDSDLPIYTVLVPLRDEAHMVPQMAQALRRLDYPAERLDIKFVVESTSPRTISAVQRHLKDARFSLVVVPRRPPHTKPKALNFALPLARGDYVTVFDAEDVPERMQLRKSATLFARNPDIACLQAHLLVTNGGTNWIARLFAAEYAGHFGVLLPAIARLGLPVPLGGTSNHFRREILQQSGGWDAFNVTEDADLGIRLGRLGHRIATFDSYTSEESTTTVGAWLRQRGRWMKGWMQTLIVHNANPGRLLADLGWRGVVAFQIMVGSMVLSISIHGILLGSTLVQTAAEIMRNGAPALAHWISLGILLVGYLGAVLVSMIGLVRIGRRDLWPSLLFLPFYWMLAWLATVHAAIELIYRPHHWAKTHHSGLNAAGQSQDEDVLGKAPLLRPRIAEIG
jgi:glycosyltransferase XagB